MNSFKVGDVVKNKKRGLVRRITRIVRDRIYWKQNQSDKTGCCGADHLLRWSRGKDL